VSPGEFTVTRFGNTNEALLLFVEFSGTATSGTIIRRLLNISDAGRREQATPG
jgi:hypothetical protein